METKPSKDTIDKIRQLRGAAQPPKEVNTAEAQVLRENSTATSLSTPDNVESKKQIRTLIINGKILNNDPLDQFIDSLVQ